MSANLSQKTTSSWFLSVLLCLLSIPFVSLTITQAPAQSGQSFKMHVDVELVTTEVAALDKTGKPVPNLKKENFRLYEDGKEQEIYSFDAVTGDADTATQAPGSEEGDRRRGKTILIVFDDSTIASGHLKAARDSAARFAREHMRPQDLFAVAAFGHSLRILQNFTGDRDRILQAIAQPAVSSAAAAFPRDLQTTPSPSPGKGQSRLDQQRADSEARSNALTANFQVENLLRALEALNVSIERLRGQKSVLLYSESGFFSRSAIENVYFRTVNSAKKSNVVFYTVDPGGLSSNTVGEVRNPDGKGRAFRSAGMAGGLVNSMFQQGGGKTGGSGGGSSGGSGGSTSGGTTGGTGSGSGSGSSGSTGGVSTGTSLGPGAFSSMDRDLDNAFGSLRQGQQSLLKSLASDSGGLSIYNTNNYDAELDKLDQQLSNYYILGFQSNNPKHNGQFRKIEIKTSIKGLTLRYPKGYLDRRPVDTLTNSKQEKSLLDAMVAPKPQSQIPVLFRAAYFYDSPRLARVMVLAKMSMAKVELKKKGGDLAGDLNVMGVAYSEDGGVAARFSETLHLAVPKEGEQDFRNAKIGYRNYLKVRPGKYRLKLVTLDEANNLGSMEQTVEIPALPQSGIAGSSLVLAEDVSRLPDLIRDIEARLLDDTDPLGYSGLQVSPRVENRVPVDSPIPAFFKVYSIGGSFGDWKLTAKVKLVGSKGEELALPPIALNNNISRISDSEATIGITLPFKGIPPGNYTLIIETSAPATLQAVTVQTELEFMKN